MKPPAFYLVVGASALALLTLSNTSDRGVGDQLAAIVDDFREECTNEGCSTHEVEELHESYSEECLSEGCSFEEIRELGGSAAGAEDMLADFRRRGWTVAHRCDSFTLGSVTDTWPTTPGKMNCKCKFFFYCPCKGLGAEGHRYEWNSAGGVPTSATRCKAA